MYSLSIAFQEAQMNGYKTTVQSEYYRDVKRIIQQYGAGRGTFLPTEIAAAMGALKKGYSSVVTMSLRRALTQAELDGLVTPCSMITERGGRGKYFEVHVQMRQWTLEDAPVINPPF